MIAVTSNPGTAQVLAIVAVLVFCLATGAAWVTKAWWGACVCAGLALLAASLAFLA